MSSNGWMKTAVAGSMLGRCTTQGTNVILFNLFIGFSPAAAYRSANKQLTHIKWVVDPKFIGLWPIISIIFLSRRLQRATDPFL